MYHQEVSGAPLLFVILLETLKHFKYSGCFSVLQIHISVFFQSNPFQKITEIFLSRFRKKLIPRYHKFTTRTDIDFNSTIKLLLVFIKMK